MVLPLYAYMRQNLTKATCDKAYPVILQNAAAAGLLKLNKYYSYALDSQYTLLATGMSFCSLILYDFEFPTRLVRSSTPETPHQVVPQPWRRRSQQVSRAI